MSARPAVNISSKFSPHCFLLSGIKCCVLQYIQFELFYIFLRFCKSSHLVFGVFSVEPYLLQLCSCLRNVTGCVHGGSVFSCVTSKQQARIPVPPSKIYSSGLWPRHWQKPGSLASVVDGGYPLNGSRTLKILSPGPSWKTCVWVVSAGLRIAEPISILWEEGGSSYWQSVVFWWGLPPEKHFQQDLCQVDIWNISHGFGNPSIWCV